MQFRAGALTFRGTNISSDEVFVNEKYNSCFIMIFHNVWAKITKDFTKQRIVLLMHQGWCTLFLKKRTKWIFINIFIFFRKFLPVNIFLFLITQGLVQRIQISRFAWQHDHYLFKINFNQKCIQYGSFLFIWNIWVWNFIGIHACLIYYDRYFQNT